jgi:polyhydroxybutyrate depolymerase
MNMNVHLFITFFFLLCISKAQTPKNALDISEPKPHRIRMDSLDRTYYVHIPKNLKKKAPLVFVFHGYSGSALGTLKETKFNDLADQYGFAVCYPQGYKDQKGNAFWQVGYSFHKDLKVDDIQFVKTITAKLQDVYGLSQEHIFISGFSNGGDFCNLLSCQTQDIFKASAPIISCFMKEFYDKCSQTHSIPTFILNGTDDPITYWDGDMLNQQGYGAYLSTEAMLDFRIKQIKYNQKMSDTLFNPSKNDPQFVSVDRYINTVSNEQVWMYKVINGGHGYPAYIHLEERIWDFFSLYIND